MEIPHASACHPAPISLWRVGAFIHGGECNGGLLLFSSSNSYHSSVHQNASGILFHASVEIAVNHVDLGSLYGRMDSEHAAYQLVVPRPIILRARSRMDANEPLPDWIKPLHDGCSFSFSTSSVVFRNEHIKLFHHVIGEPTAGMVAPNQIEKMILRH
ncbi:MAG: hypothetical protein R2788_03025 [Saprospiraceae bacterium]